MIIVIIVIIAQSAIVETPRQFSLVLTPAFLAALVHTDHSDTGLIAAKDSILPFQVGSIFSLAFGHIVPMG
jgi:hypothetical protein